VSIIQLSRYIASIAASPLARWSDQEPWEMVAQSEAVVRALLAELPAHEFTVTGEVAIHHSATVEPGSVLKAPLVLGAGCFVAAGAYLRGGNWVAENCIFGPGSELKSSFVFAGTKLAHFNFVGDSVLGENVNFEAGSIVCNYRNERSSKDILVRVGSALHHTGKEKFGALVGDGSRIGANAVIAPGAILLPGTVIRRTELLDQETSAKATRG
jgi:UDP-N-acetylglucosamine diphosphorylase / glucose-1-phosphate thymidylyltransferase / UDP-N-acetylgalactosamine diphosphorylase / glucosamine-1-phosphate N-acetyltransferase / galactosamine-1-phosphate N-acetyltransferase